MNTAIKFFKLIRSQRIFMNLSLLQTVKKILFFLFSYYCTHLFYIKISSSFYKVLSSNEEQRRKEKEKSKIEAKVDKKKRTFPST